MTRIRLIGAIVGAVAFATLGVDAACAQHLGQAVGNEVDWWRVGGSLALCLVLAVVAAVVLKKRMIGGGPGLVGGFRRLQLVETLRLSHQVDVCLLRCDSGHLLIAATPQGAVLLANELAPVTSSDGRE
jgi:flagellar biogenesis protein FliO